MKHRRSLLSLTSALCLSLSLLLPVSVSAAGSSFFTPAETAEAVPAPETGAAEAVASPETEAALAPATDTAPETALAPETEASSEAALAPATDTAPETAIAPAPDASASDPAAPTAISDAEKAFLTAGAAAVCEWGGKTWTIGAEGLLSYENGVKTASFPGSFVSICAGKEGILLIRNEAPEETEKHRYALVQFDPADGTFLHLQDFSLTSSSPYFLTRDSEHIWIYHNGALLALDEAGNLHPTPLQTVFYLSENSIYLPEETEENESYGLVCCPKEAPFTGFSYPELSGVPVSAWFSYEDRLYLTAGTGAAYVLLDSQDDKVRTLPVDLSIPGEATIMTSASYYQSPADCLLFAVGTSEDSAGQFHVHFFRYTPLTGETKELTVLRNTVLPLCWLSVSGDILYAYLLTDTIPVANLATGEILGGAAEVTGLPDEVAETAAVPGETAVPASLPEETEAPSVLWVGTNADYPPFESWEGEEIVGFDMDLLQLLSEQLGFSYELVETPFDSLIPELQSGNLDLVISGMADTPDRRTQVDFTLPYYSEYDPDYDETYSYAIALPKGSPLTEPLNDALLRLTEDGTLDTLAESWGLAP